MKLFSRIKLSSQRFLRIFAILPLIILHANSHAEIDLTDVKPTPAEFSQAEIDQLLAPIALYPDTILSQVLIASTYPIEVVQADRWARTNTSEKGADAVKLVEKKDWDPSVKALVAFPDILKRMSDDIDWTQKLGDAFLSDEGRVMDSIQSLRKKAYASGSLNKVQHLKVQREDDGIVIEPAEERVVYVPVYDTRVVYGNWWWPDYPPVYWHHPSYTYVSGFYWGSSIFVGPSFFYSSCHWRQRHVVVVNNHYGPRPYFYTGRSIVHYHGSIEWRHAPIHRRGVAYYNERLRNDYGSRHESYREARVYRDSHSGTRREERDSNYTPTHAQTRFDERNPGNSRISRTNGIRFAEPGAPATTNDRSELLRERMQRTRETTDKPRGGETVERTSNPETVQSNDRNADRLGTRTETQLKDRQNDRDTGDSNWNRNIDRSGNSRAAPTELYARPENGDGGNTNEQPSRVITARPTINNDGGGSRLDRIQQDRTQSRIDRGMRVDDSMSRRVEAAPRQERGNSGDSGGRNRGGSRDEDRARR